MSKQTNYSGNIGFGGALFLIFLVLKLTGYITWSWWWVFSPIWVPLLLILLIFVAAIYGYLKEIEK